MIPFNRATTLCPALATSLCLEFKERMRIFLSFLKLLLSVARCDAVRCAPLTSRSVGPSVWQRVCIVRFMKCSHPFIFLGVEVLFYSSTSRSCPKTTTPDKRAWRWIGRFGRSLPGGMDKRRPAYQGGAGRCGAGRCGASVVANPAPALRVRLCRVPSPSLFSVKSSLLAGSRVARWSWCARLSLGQVQLYSPRHLGRSCLI